MLRKKFAAAAALGTAVALTLAGCGVGGGDSSSSDKSITVLVEAGGHAELQPIADLYKKDTGTTVTFVELPYDGLYNRLNSEFTSGSVSCDVAALDSIWLPAFKDAVTPLDKLFTPEVKSDLFPALVKEANVDGTYAGMPVWTNSEILYYRKDLFDDAANKAAFKTKYGYDLVPPTTWQQYQDAAEFFTQPDKGLYGTDVKGAVETEYLATLSQTGEKTMVLNNSGSEISLGDENSLKALDFYTGLQKYAPAGSAQLDWAGAQNLFNQGKTAMMRFWAHAYRQIPKDASVYGKVGVAPMIAGPGGIAGVPGAWYLSVAKASKKQQQGLDFVKFAYEHNELSAKTSLGLVARKSAFEKYQDQPGYENYKPLVETLDATATIPRPATPKWQQIVDTVLVPMIQKSLQPGADKQALLNAAKEQVQSLVK
ncbi:ABC transporter substrate-binding protein [Leifsonia sp. 21MFCrub1.1]|uniref:ABC transporter substrate-binding protein n=1 Tax=Leifsonia sp. 21MFCrub1.1 TaxID=1798223 RepID=UPI00089284D3|nr:sugar ABC transporter substrate-binding protein [Leifsonia sp. 21MFCrub1.1]SEB05413.1 ABC-type glycerol-3-phosphate transport system, substrate-binding protein [Leifsonia sp. 21MFCrub1.1]